MFPIAWMCRKLGVERSSYYAWKNRQGKPISYVLRRKSLAGVVCEIFTEQKRRAGARGIAAELAKRGYVASVRLVGRIMRENGLVAVQSAAYKKPQHREPVSEVMVVDHVEQDFTPCHYEPG